MAKVTTRRARKGFQLQYNPDKHWSAALYRTLGYLQFTDGIDILNINRDDASGYRLDTLTTHKQHATPTVQDHSILTTHTDYVTRYPAVLQTSCYNFTHIYSMSKEEDQITSDDCQNTVCSCVVNLVHAHAIMTHNMLNSMQYWE